MTSTLTYEETLEAEEMTKLKNQLYSRGNSLSKFKKHDIANMITEREKYDRVKDNFKELERNNYPD